MKSLRTSSIQRNNHNLIVLCLLGLFLAVGVLSLLLGPESIAPGQVLQGLFDPADTIARRIILYVRLPRTLAGLLAGAALACAGVIVQVVLSNPMEAQAEGSLFDVYRVLRTTNPSPYMFYFSSDDIEVSGASPETLAKLQDGALYTFPLAGTRPRGKTSAEDRQLEQELLPNFRQAEILQARLGNTAGMIGAAIQAQKLCC